MKNKLIHQSSNYDCGPTSVTNAMRFLFEREEIPPALLKQIWTMGLDTFSAEGEPGREGTSKAAMRYMAAWFDCYAAKHAFPLKSAFLDMELSSFEPGSLPWRCLEKGGCAVLRVELGHGHYVLLTGLLPDGEIGLFDPYDEYPDKGDPGVRYVLDAPKQMNRAVRPETLNLEGGSDYAQGPLDRRECLLFWRPEERRR